MNVGGYIDFDKLSQEDIKRFESCFYCHKSIEINIKLKNPITYRERMALSLPTVGEIHLCKECADNLDKTILPIITRKENNKWN